MACSGQFSLSLSHKLHIREHTTLPDFLVASHGVLVPMHSLETLRAEYDCIHVFILSYLCFSMGFLLCSQSHMGTLVSLASGQMILI